MGFTIFPIKIYSINGVKMFHESGSERDRVGPNLLFKNLTSLTALFEENNIKDCGPRRDILKKYPVEENQRQRPLLVLDRYDRGLVEPERQ